MTEGTTVYCGDNCNHTGPHRYRPADPAPAAGEPYPWIEHLAAPADPAPAAGRLRMRLIAVLDDHGFIDYPTPRCDGDDWEQVGDPERFFTDHLADKVLEVLAAPPPSAAREGEALRLLTEACDLYDRTVEVNVGTEAEPIIQHDDYDAYMLFDAAMDRIHDFHEGLAASGEPEE